LVPSPGASPISPLPPFPISTISPFSLFRQDSSLPPRRRAPGHAAQWELRGWGWLLERSAPVTAWRFQGGWGLWLVSVLVGRVAVHSHKRVQIPMPKRVRIPQQGQLQALCGRKPVGGGGSPQLLPPLHTIWPALRWCPRGDAQPAEAVLCLHKKQAETTNFGGKKNRIHFIGKKFFLKVFFALDPSGCMRARLCAVRMCLLATR
jgi:hypothetical protein